MDEGNMTVGHSLSEAKASRQSPIAANTMQLEKAVAVVQDEMNMLLDKLQPILAPVEPTDKADGENPVPPQSDFAAFLEREAHKLHRLGGLIHVTRERVEL